MAIMQLSVEEANNRMGQMDDGVHQAELLANKILDRATEMTASSWRGNKSQLFAQTMMNHHDDFQAVVNNLKHIAATGKENINAVVSHEG
jgi:hypothetical protein